MSLSQKQLKDVCLAHDNTSDKCRYLAQDDTDWNKYYCLKLSGKKSEIDVETDDFIKDMRRKGKDPYKENAPLGDNCNGYPVLKHISQGYDV